MISNLLVIFLLLTVIKGYQAQVVCEGMGLPEINMENYEHQNRSNESYFKENFASNFIWPNIEYKVEKITIPSNQIFEDIEKIGEGNFSPRFDPVENLENLFNQILYKLNKENINMADETQVKYYTLKTLLEDPNIFEWQVKNEEELRSLTSNSAIMIQTLQDIAKSNISSENIEKKHLGIFAAQMGTITALINISQLLDVSPYDLINTSVYENSFRDMIK